MRTQFITAKQVGKIMGVGRTRSYSILSELNAQLEKMGYLTIPGKCPIQFFKEKCYGMVIDDEELAAMEKDDES